MQTHIETHTDEWTDGQTDTERKTQTHRNNGTEERVTQGGRNQSQRQKAKQ